MPGQTGRSRRRLGLIWLGSAALMAGGLAASQASYSGLDDTHIAYERPGLLDLSGSPRSAPVLSNLPKPGRRAVFFVTRPERVAALESALKGDHPLQVAADVLIVVPAAAGEAGPIPVVSDAGRDVALQLGIRQPRDGGFPVGYALVDSGGRVRYSTLDPEVTDHLDEIHTMLGAMP